MGIKSRNLLIALMGITVVVSLSFLIYKKAIFADTSNTVTIQNGWGFLSGNQIYQTGLNNLLDSGVILYTYNDPSANSSIWTFIVKDCSSWQVPLGLKCQSTLALNPALSYMYYNPGSTKTFNKIYLGVLADQEFDYKTGWHILAWENSETDRDKLMKSYRFKTVGSQEQTFDRLVDQKLASSQVYSLEASSGTLNFKILGYQDTANTTSKLRFKNAWVYLYNDSSKITLSPPASGNFAFGINAQVSFITGAANNGQDFYSDLNNLNMSMLRMIHFDAWLASRASDLATANRLKSSGQRLMGTFCPNGTIDADRQGTVLDRSGRPYTTYLDVVHDLNYYYSEMTKGGTTQTQININKSKLIALINDLYFKNLVIPRLTSYKDIVKDWQQWNEPDGTPATTDWGIPAEILVLVTSGRVTVNAPIATDPSHKEELFLGTEKIAGYDVSGGVSALLKNICSDCKLVSAGFYLTKPAYFQTLKQNNYNDYVDAEEIHLNLYPKIFMGYTQYETNTLKTLKIYHWLCDKDGNEATYDCGKPLYSTESASPSDIKYSNHQNYHYPNFSMTYSEEFQADDLAKRLVTISGYNMTVINWNGYINAPGGGKDCPKVLSGNYYLFNYDEARCAHQFKGLYYKFPNSFGKKPSYDAFRVMSGKLKYSKSVEALRKGDDNHNEANPTFLYKITDQDNKQKFAAWCEPFWNVKDPTTADDNPSIYKDWNYEERNCNQTLDLKAYGITGKVILTGRDGAIKESSSSSITLSKSPIFIESK